MTITAVSADGVAHAFPDGTDTAVIGKVMQDYAAQTSGSPAPSAPAAPPDTSMSGAFGYGVDNTAHALGDTAEVLGAPGLGKTLQGVNMAPKGYQPADITGAIRDGRYGDILPNMARKGVEMLPAIGGLAGAAALTPEALGTAGALGVAGAGSAALHYGQNVKASAANNGDAAPTRGDYVRGALTTLPQAGLDAVGLRVPGLGSVASSTLGKAGVRTLADAATGAASDQVGQVGTSIGTKAGLQDNPMQSAEAALGALPARAMSQAPGLVKAGIKTGSDAAMSRLVEQPTSVDNALAIEQANQAIDFAHATAGRKLPPTTAANNAKSQVAETLKSTFNALADNYPELITRDDRSNFGATLNQALRHNNATGDSHSLDTATLLDQVGSLNLPAEATGPLVSGLRTLDVLSNASFQKQQVGPFRAVGNAVANVGALAAPLMAGNLPGGLEAGLGLAVGHNVAGRMGGAVGGAVDRAMGTNTPVAVLQRAAAQRMLAKAGAATPGDPVAALQAVRDAAGERPPVVDNTAANNAASAAYGAAQERDSASVSRAQAQAAKLRAQQIEAAYAQNAAQPPTPPTASPDFARAEAQVPQAPNPSDAYLAGRAVPGMDGTSALGAQTAAEIAGWAQMQRNRSTALKDAQRAMAVGAKADASTPEAKGQAALDANARRNAATLAAASAVPSRNPGVDAVASDAAVAQARQRAAAVMKAAGIEPPDELGNPPDPVPVNTPIRGPAQQPSEAPPAAPQAQAPVAPMGMPQQAPVVPQAAPGGPVTPLHGYADAGLRQMHGIAVTPEMYHAGIDSMQGAGVINPIQAQSLRTSPMGFDKAIGEMLKQHILGLPQAVGLPATKTQAQFGPAPPDSTVRRAAAYLYSTQSYHLDAGRLADRARAEGMPEVANAVEEIEHARDPAAKAQMRDAFLGTLSPTDRAYAAQYLPDRLVTHGKK